MGHTKVPLVQHPVSSSSHVLLGSQQVQHGGKSSSLFIPSVWYSERACLWRIQVVMVAVNRLSIHESYRILVFQSHQLLSVKSALYGMVLPFLCFESVAVNFMVWSQAVERIYSLSTILLLHSSLVILFSELDKEASSKVVLPHKEGAPILRSFFGYSSVSFLCYNMLQ